MSRIALPQVIKFSSIFIGIFLLLEIAIRRFSGISNIDSIAENIFISLLFSLLLFYATKPFKILLSLFLLVSLLIQASNAIFYGGWIEPMNLYLLFENITEVMNTAVQVNATIIVKSLVFSVIALLSIAYLFKLNKHKGSLWINFIIILILVFQPLRDGVFKPEKIEKRFTKDSHSLVRSFHNAYGVFFSMLISESLAKNLYPNYRQNPYPQVLKTENITPDIYIYFGESLSANYMSTYGYKKNTTPNLKQLLASLPTNKKLFGLSKKTIAGATATMPATVRFFHMISQPDGRKQAASFDTNLFQYAKKSEYQTTYLATQAENYINHIYKLMAGKYADTYLSPPLLDHSNNARTEMDDGMLVKILDQVDNTTPSFVVLQPNGSHTPFSTRSPHAFKHFGSKSELLEYENSIYYTDNLIKGIVGSVIWKAKRPWILIITSDHGTFVDDSHITRSIKYSESYTVPGIILTNNKQLYDSHIRPLEQCAYLFHQNISEMIARVLGFDVPVRDCNSGVLFTGLLNGMGAKSILIEQGKAQMRAYTPINTHQESKNAQ